METRDIARLALNAALVGAEYVRGRYLHVGSVLEKTDVTDLVTDVDVGAEQVIREFLQVHLPSGHIVVGEEFGGSVRDDVDFLWFVDPIDGTANFAKGIPLFSVSVGVLSRDGFVAGAVVAPVLGQVIWGGRGIGVFMGGRSVRVSSERDFSKAYVGIGFPRRCGSGNMRVALKFQEYASTKARKMRSIGTAALGLAWVAAGLLDVYWQPCLNLWDAAAGAALILAAGGFVRMGITAPGTWGIWASSDAFLFDTAKEVIGPHLDGYAAENPMSLL